LHIYEGQEKQRMTRKKDWPYAVTKRSGAVIIYIALIKIFFTEIINEDTMTYVVQSLFALLSFYITRHLGAGAALHSLQFFAHFTVLRVFTLRHRRLLSS